jgi:hypothetical protein
MGLPAQQPVSELIQLSTLSTNTGNVAHISNNLINYVDKIFFTMNMVEQM